MTVGCSSSTPSASSPKKPTATEPAATEATEPAATEDAAAEPAAKLAESEAPADRPIDPLGLAQLARTRAERHFARNGPDRQLGLRRRAEWQRPVEERGAGRASPARSCSAAKLYTIVRDQPGTHARNEKVICVDAATGKKIWENKFYVFLSDVPARARRLVELRRRSDDRADLCLGRVRLLPMPRRRHRQDDLEPFAERRVRSAQHLWRPDQCAGRVPTTW